MRRSSSDINTQDFRVLATGIDTMTFTAPLRPSSKLLAELAHAKARAQDHDQGDDDLARRRLEEASDAADEGIDAEGLWRLAGCAFEVSPSGCVGYAFGLLSEHHGNVWVSEDRGVKVELGSYPLWHKGPAGAYREARGFLRALFDVGDHFPCSPTRIDFCVDFQGWTPRRDELAAMVTRSTIEGDEAHEQHCALCRAPIIGAALFCPRCGHRHYTVNEGPRSLVDVRRALEAGALVPPLSPSELLNIAAARASSKLGFDQPPERWEQPGPLPPARWGSDWRELDARSFGRRREFTGWRWGSGKPLLSRLYNKSVEIRDRSPDKVWFSSVWLGGWHPPLLPRANMFDPELGSVWRLEVQCRREFLRAFAVDGVELETVDAFIEQLPTVWQFLVGLPYRRCVSCHLVPDGQRIATCRNCGGKCRRPRGWLELRRPDHQAPSRWPLHPAWALLQAVPFTFAGRVPGCSRLRQDARLEVVTPMAAGCLSTMASELGLVDQLRRELGRTPDAQEVVDAACLALVAEVPPAVFRAQVARKDSLRRSSPSMETRFGPEPPRPEVAAFRSAHRRAVAGDAEGEASPLMRSLARSARRPWATVDENASELEQQIDKAQAGLIVTDPNGRRWRRGMELQPDV